MFKIANAQRENNGMAKYINATDKSISQKQREIRIYRKNKGINIKGSKLWKLR